MASPDRKGMLYIVSTIITQWMQWYYGQCNWHHLLLMPVPTVSNDWKGHVVTHFGKFELTNTMLLLMMPSVLCNANIGITKP